MLLSRNTVCLKSFAFGWLRTRASLVGFLCVHSRRRHAHTQNTCCVPRSCADLVSKSGALRVMVGGKPVHIGGMCKGSGMIHPNMATMLGVVTCDAAVTPEVWRGMVKRASIASFNQITVGGGPNGGHVSQIHCAVAPKAWQLCCPCSVWPDRARLTQAVGCAW